MKARRTARAGRRGKRPSRPAAPGGAPTAGLPSGFVTRVMTDLGPDEGERLLAALNGTPDQGLRVNSRVGDVADVVARLGWSARPLPWAPEGVVLLSDPVATHGGGHAAASHPWHDAGAYYLQDPSAMGVVPVLDPRPGEWVLDLAAAPGGKSTYIADRLAGTGLLWSHDVDAGRVAALVGNLERWGVGNVVVSHGPIERLTPLHGAFDRVLLDAPCSGEGMFRKSRAALDLWSPGRVAEFAASQARLLDQAVPFLKPGGTLVYSTCTFGADEDEGAIAALLGRRDDLAAEAFSATGAASGLEPYASSTGLSGAVARWWPHRHDGEGHFVARLRKTAPSYDSQPRGEARTRGSPGTEPSRSDVAALESFSQDVLGGALPLEGGVRLFGDWLHALPDVDLPPALGDGRVRPRRIGAPLGRQSGGRFEPHHALARLLPDHGQRAAHVDLSVTDARTAAYLRGEVIPADVPDGWLVVRIAGLPLGWAKAKRGELNNHYPKGLRRG